MTAIKTKDVARFMANRPADTHVVLFFGQDQGLIRTHAQRLGKSVVEDLNDPFNAIELSETDLSEAGRLSDEAAALSFMGGERLIRIRSGGTPVANAVSLLLDGIKDGRITPNALTVIEAGDLKKSNSLRKACESSPRAAAIACYPEGARDMMGSIRTMLEAEGLSIADDALMLLSSSLGEDRGITNSVVEALILYKGPKGLPRDNDLISLEDVRACAVDSAADATFDIVDYALSGEPKRLSQCLYRAENAGVSPIAILRITQNKLLRLLTAQAKIREGESVANAMKQVRPPVFFTEQRSFEQQLKLWSLRRLETTLQDVLATDLAAKTTGAPQQELIERTLLRMAASVARGR